MNTYHLKQKWDRGEYLSVEEIDFLFAEIDRMEKALAGTERLLREERSIDKVKMAIALREIADSI